MTNGFCDRLNSAYGTRRGRWLLGAALACACMALTLAFCRVTFLNNDDANILYALAGYRSGTPYPTHRFINAALGLIISGLYRAIPALPWWTVYQLLALLAALTVINACALRLAHRAGLPLFAALIALLLFYFAVFAYAVTWIAFTLTAGMLGTAACALILATDGEQDSQKIRIASAVGAAVLLLLCFFTRNSSGYVLICFFFACVFYRLLKAKRGARLGAAGLAAAGAATAVAAVLLNTWGVARFNPPYYAEFESARGHFIDYPHVAYADDPAFFASLGWDETIYDLADNLCYLDPAVDADAMNAVMAYRSADNRSIIKRLADTLTYGETYFRGSGISQYLLVIPALGTAWLILSAIRRKRWSAEVFAGGALAAGAFLLCFYLCYAGRFPVRIFQLIAIPTAVLEWMLLLKTWGDKREFSAISDISGAKQGKCKRIAPHVGIFVTSAAIAWSLAMTQSTLLSYDKSGVVERNAAAEAYAVAHGENFYLTDVTSLENIDPFAVYKDPESRPVNLVDWGGTGMYSGWKEAQLAANGLTALNVEALMRENAYFITAENGEKLTLLNAYLTAHAGATGYTLCETLPGGIAVYRFEFSGEGGGAG